MIFFFLSDFDPSDLYSSMFGGFGGAEFGFGGADFGFGGTGFHSASSHGFCWGSAS